VVSGRLVVLTLTPFFIVTRVKGTRVFFLLRIRRRRRRRRHIIIETRAHVLRGKSYLEESRNFFGARLSTDSFFRRWHAFSLCRDYSRKLVYRSSEYLLSLSLFLRLIICFCNIKIILLTNTHTTRLRIYRQTDGLRIRFVSSVCKILYIIRSP